jgi:hypothetical protein
VSPQVSNTFNRTVDEQYIYHNDNITGVSTVVPYIGTLWVDALSHGQSVTVTIPGPNSTQVFLEQLENQVTGGYATDFTQWGPTFELEAATDLTAPGGSILSLFPVVLGGYRVMTGTSMCTNSPLLPALWE